MPQHIAITINRPEDEVRRFWDGPQTPATLKEAVESVRFTPAPGGRGTEVHVHLKSDGGIAAAVSKMVDSVRDLVSTRPPSDPESALRRLKQHIEAGEVAVSDATIHGRPHPAIPPSDETVKSARRAA